MNIDPMDMSYRYRVFDDESEIRTARHVLDQEIIPRLNDAIANSAANDEVLCEIRMNARTHARIRAVAQIWYVDYCGLICMEKQYITTVDGAPIVEDEDLCDGNVEVQIGSQDLADRILSGVERELRQEWLSRKESVEEALLLRISILEKYLREERDKTQRLKGDNASHERAMSLISKLLKGGGAITPTEVVELVEERLKDLTLLVEGDGFKPKPVAEVKPASAANSMPATNPVTNPVTTSKLIKKIP